jgi:hypothetical protein
MSMESHGGMMLTGKNSLIHPPELSCSLTTSHLAAEHEEHGKEMLNFANKISLSY